MRTRRRAEVALKKKTACNARQLAFYAIQHAEMPVFIAVQPDGSNSGSNGERSGRPEQSADHGQRCTHRVARCGAAVHQCTGRLRCRFSSTPCTAKMFLARSIPGAIMLMDFPFAGSNGRLRHHHFGTLLPCGFSAAPSGWGSPFHSLGITYGDISNHDRFPA